MSIDSQTIAHSTWNCKYHIFLHQSIEEKYSMVRKEEGLEQF